MGLKCGIVGLPNVGKSTLFNALTSARALAANFPFATKDPNIGMITVPDPRLDKLAALVNPRQVTPTTVEILDIAGLIKGASKGEGLGNQFLANIREVNALVHVVRCFENDQVVHVDGSIDPVRDKEVIDLELILKDLETLENRLEKLHKQAKSGKKEDQASMETAKRLYAHLSEQKAAREYKAGDTEREFIKEMMLLTDKPVLYVCNVDEDSVKTGNAYSDALKEAVMNEDAEVILVSVAIEADIAELETQEERMEFVRDMDLDEPGVNRLIRACYTLLDLITFFTAGPTEVRAWTVRRGARAPEAAGEIHTDFEKGFIRAEVIKYEDYVAYDSEHAVKEAGKMSVEGKEYVVRDGDVIYFRFNV